MNKRGQVTIFIILGIVIVAIISLLIMFRGDILPGKEIGIKDITINPELINVQEHVQDCIELTAPTGLFVLGLQGGYINTPEGSLQTELSEIAYGYNTGKRTLVTKQRMESEFSDYMNLFLPLCTDFSEFPNLDVNPGDVTTEVTITEDLVTTTIDYPLEIVSGTETFNLDDLYYSDFRIRLGLLHDISKEIVTKLLKDPDDIDLTFLLDTGMDVDILPIDDTTYVYSLTDLDYRLGNITYTFMFANKIL